MGEVLWTMLLIGLPLLYFGREGVARWQRGLSSGALQGFVIWGWISLVVCVLWQIGSEDEAVLPGFLALIFALGILGWIAAHAEQRRRGSGGVRETAAQQGQHLRPPHASPTPGRPLSFMRELEAKERRLIEQAAQPPAPGMPELLPPPAPVARHVETAPLSSPPPTSVFAMPRGGQPNAVYAEPQAGLAAAPAVAAAAPPPLPQQSALGAAPLSPQRFRSSGGKTGRQEAERNLAQSRLVGLLREHLGGLLLETDSAATLELPLASAPLFAPRAAEQSAVPVETPEAATVDPAPVYVPPEPPPASGPVTLGGGFSYKPTLVESRLGKH